MTDETSARSSNERSDKDAELQRVYNLVDHWFGESRRLELLVTQKNAEIERLRAGIQQCIDQWASEEIRGELRRLLEGGAVETNDAADAAKWRALRDCSRITAMGCAGLTQPHNADADYAHLTLNFWTGVDDGDPGPAYAREWLDKFVAKALRPAVKANACPKSDDGLHRPNMFSSPLSCSECNALLRAAR